MKHPRRKLLKADRLLFLLLLVTMIPGTAPYSLTAQAGVPQAPQAISYLEVAPDGPEQMPVLFIHGFKDDGVPWARREPDLFESWEDQTERCREPDPETPAAFFTAAGIENWAVQWWSTDDGNPYSSHEEGYAFLMGSEELRASADWQGGTWQAQSYPCPGLLNRRIAYPVPFVDPEYGDISFLAIQNTYNDSGRVGDQAQDLLDMLRYERQWGKLKEYQQVNLITHSKGSLVTRAMLDLASDASRQDAEYVANVVYNAPPFAGSTIAQIGTEIYGPDDLTADFFASEWFINSYGSLASASADITIGETIERMYDDFIRSASGGALSLDDLLAAAPAEVRGVLDTFKDLTSFQVTASFDWEAFSQTREAEILVDGLMEPLREVVSAMTGLPAFPTLSDNLTPAGGADHLSSYTNSSYTTQFVTYGRGGIDRSLFPCKPSGNSLPCADAVGATPNLLTDVDVLVHNEDDAAVAEGSAMLLTQTDSRGPRMELLGAFDSFNHGDMLYTQVATMGPLWMSVFLAAPTTLKLNGTIDLIDSQQRSYLVSDDTTFSFSSTPVSRHGVTVNAARHEYRVVRADNSGAAPSAWTSLSPGQSVSFATLRAAHGLTNLPFYLQWRSVNAKGGREMVRTAYFVIEPEAPQVVSQSVHTPTQAEVYRRPLKSLIGATAVRGSFFQDVPGIDALLDRITTSPESTWVVRNQSTKALALAFDHRGNVEYVWNNQGFTGTTRQTGVTGLLLPLGGLPDGLNTLYFETYNDLGQRSPRQQISILIDNSPPLVSLFYQSDHSLGYVVGPSTPIRFEIQDLESDGGSGSLTVPGHPSGSVPQNTTFTMAETNLDEQGKANGLVGANVTLTATAVDLVNNQVTEEIEIYYDWTPPEVTLSAVVDAVPVGDRAYQAYTDTVSIVVSVADGEPPLAQTTTEGGETWVSAPFVMNGVPGHSGFGGKVKLNPGENTITISSRDAVGNLGTLTLTIRYDQNDPGTEPVAILSPRLEVPLCKDVNGDTVTCSNGDIQNVASSYYGDVFVFDSAGNKWVANDTNGRRDVFAYRNGAITRVSTGGDGSEATGGDSSHPAISGNGRYVVFRSRATNLASGASGLNLYVKDLETGELAVVSRSTGGDPANVGGVTSFQKTAVTFGGRYVFFESQGTNHVGGYTDTNNARDVFMADLDPDENGDFFDDNYVIVPISTASASAMGNGESRAPDVSIDGRALVYETRATDIHPALNTNGDVTDILLVEFAGSAEDGTLDTATRTLTPINTAHFLGDGGDLTGLDARYPRVHPLGSDMVIFVTRSNVEGSGDTNNEALGEDVYASHRTGGASRFVEWISTGVGGSQSSENISAPIQKLTLAVEPSITDFVGGKKSWVSLHNNIVSGDTNDVADLFIQGTTSASSLPVINWIAPDLPSTAAVTEGGVTPDGRYAFWVSNQEYAAPYGSGLLNLFVRRIEPPITTTLTIQVVGQGTVQRTPAGTPDGGAFDYPDTARPTLLAVPETGWRFAGWQGVDSSNGETARVAMHHSRVVTATFTRLEPPASVSVDIAAEEDGASQGGAPLVVDPDPDDSHTYTILTQPANGRAEVRDNLLYYTPDRDFSGTDSFTFRATDSAGLSVDGTATVTVAPAPDPPSVEPLTITTTRDTASDPQAPAVTDPDSGDSYTLAVTIPPEHGTVSIVVGSGTQRFVYTPDPGFTGGDSFAFRVTDAAGLSTIGYATVTVTGTGTGPTPTPTPTPTATPTRTPDHPAGSRQYLPVLKRQ